MNHSDTTNSPKVRPKVLLWALLLCQVGATLFFLAKAWALHREASALDVRELEMRTSVIRTRDRIRTETDISELRSYALKSCDTIFDEWRDMSYRLHQGSQALIFSALLTAFTSVVLAYSVYGLRIKPVAS